MTTKILIVDLNPKITEACKRVFADAPNVECLTGNMLELGVDVWVTPTNAKGNMSGGLDGAIAGHLPHLQRQVREAIQKQFDGHLPVGRAVCIETGGIAPRYVVSTPTMEGESDDLRRTKNVALAFAAAFQAIYETNDMFGRPIETIAIPGLGAGTGRMDPDTCAALMLVGYRLFQRRRFKDFHEMLAALNEELVEVDLTEIARAKGTEEKHPNVNLALNVAPDESNDD